MKYLLTCFLSFILLSTTGFAQPLTKKIESAFQVFEGGSDLKFGVASLTVLNANTGEVLFARNENLGMAPASTLKTVTAATAYSLLGSNYSYQTNLLYRGDIREGVLDGDLIIKGSGDPSLGSEYYDQAKAENILKRWVAAIEGAGIKKVNGTIIGHDLLFNGQTAPEGWPWVDMGQYYGSGVSALNWRENKFKITLSPNGSVGAATTLRQTDLNSESTQIINEVKVGRAGTGDQVYAFSAPYSNKIILRGTIAVDLKKEIEISVPDGAYQAASALKDALAKEGIEVGNGVTTGYKLKSEGKAVPVSLNQLDQYQSPTISQLTHWFLKRSINLYGEAFLKTAAMRANIDSDTKKAAEWEQKYWAGRLGIEEGALKIRDGSGLSPETRVTSLAMAKILVDVKKKEWFGSFYENMPLVNNMKMKSGTIGGVLGYAGYHTSADGTPLVFVLLVNNHEGKSHPMRLKMFKMLDALK